MAEEDKIQADNAVRLAFGSTSCLHPHGDYRTPEDIAAWAAWAATRQKEIEDNPADPPAILCGHNLK